MRWIAMIATLALLGACTTPENVSPTPSPTSAQSTTSPMPSPSPSPSPSPTAVQSFPSDLPTQDDESAAIIAAWQKYWEVYEKFAADPNGFTDFTETQYVTTGEAGRTILDSLSSLREQDLKLLGGQVFRNVEVSVDGDSAEVTYCADTTKMVVVHAESGEPFEGGTADTYLETASMALGADDVWRVSNLENEEAQC